MHSELSKSEEAGYRRGFDQGMFVVLQMLKNGRDIEYIQQQKDEVYKWRYNGKYGKDDIRIDPPIVF